MSIQTSNLLNQLSLSADELMRIQNAVDALGPVGQYTQAYREVLAIDADHVAQGLSHLDGTTRYWFTQAADINANNPDSNAN